MHYELPQNNLFQGAYLKIKNWLFPTQDNQFTPQFLRGNFLFYVLVVLLVIRLVATSIFLPLSKNIFFADVTKIDLVNLLNKNRAEIGLHTLAENEKLNRAAYLKAQDMLYNKYFSHNSPDGITPWFWFKKVEYKYKYAGENLAIGFVDSKNVYDAWFNSPSHQVNLLNKNYKEVGTAVVQGFGSNNSTLVVQLFGNPVLASPANPTIMTPSTTVNLTLPKSAPLPKSQSEKPIEVQKPAPVNEDINATQKVLAQSTQYPLLSKWDSGDKNTPYYQFLNFMIYDSDRALAYISYAILLLTGACLLISMMINFQIAKKQLILKGLVLMGVIYASTFISQDLLHHIIPYQVII